MNLTRTVYKIMWMAKMQLAGLMRTDLSLANTEHYNDRYVNNNSNCNNVNNKFNINNVNNHNFGGKIQILATIKGWKIIVMVKGSVEPCPLIMLISHQNLQLVELMFEKSVEIFFRENQNKTLCSSYM